MTPLCLVGMSGVGKSFWAKRLESVGWFRADCDGRIGALLAALVEVRDGEEPVHALGRWMGMPWSEGYAAREARYLELEERVTRAALDAVVQQTTGSLVDATGSVVYLSSDLLADLRARTRVVHLRTPPERYGAMLRRYLEEPKPVVFGGAFEVRAGEDPLEALPRCYEHLLQLRDARYEALCHVSIDARDLGADLSAEGFLSLVGG